MKTIEIVRSYLKDRTVGFMQMPSGESLMTLERPWLDNRQNVSCIPEGTYIVKRDHHGRFQWYAVQNVRGRSAIEFHEGVQVINSDGCILVGMSHNSGFGLSHSVDACKQMVAELGEDDFKLVIRSYNPMSDIWP